MQLTSKSDVILQRTVQRKKKQCECPHGTTEEHTEPQQASGEKRGWRYCGYDFRSHYRDTDKYSKRTRQGDQRNRTKKPTKVSKYATEKKDSLFKRMVTAKLDISL